MNRKSHLDVEQPQFQGTPHAWIQWKGTNVCADIHCSCGTLTHFDGDFMYFITCGACGTLWEVGTHVALHPPTSDYHQQAEPNVSRVPSTSQK